MTTTTNLFEPTADGWVHLAPHGTFPHPNGSMQVLDAEACEAIVRTFGEEARQPNFPGLLVDFDHFSHDPAQPTTAAGWIGALEHRADGLYAKVRWSDLGQEALTGGRYRLASPVWNRGDCDQWTAPAGAAGAATVHLRPRRLDRVALTNDPNLPGLAPVSNRREAAFLTGEQEAPEGGRTDGEKSATDRSAAPGSAEEDGGDASCALRATGQPVARTTEVQEMAPSLRTEMLRGLKLAGTAADEEIAEALRRQTAELEALRNRCARLQEAQAEADLERFGGVITNREVVRAQLIANRDGTLALLNALRRPEAPAPWHQPRVNRPNLQLLSPVATEPDPSAARRVANRARQLQSQLKIGHHAAFRMAEGEAADPEAA